MKRYLFWVSTAVAIAFFAAILYVLLLTPEVITAYTETIQRRDSNHDVALGFAILAFIASGVAITTAIFIDEDKSKAARGY